MDNTGSCISPMECAVITHIIVVGFHHQFGPKVEFVYPQLEESEGKKDERTGLPPSWEGLPFLALPDGVHRTEEDYSFFTLPSLPSQQQQINFLYGVSCFRQIHVRNVLNNSEAYTRTQVQKAVCALTNVPVLGAIQARLSLVTHAYFDQGNFENTELLPKIYEQLNSSLSLSIDEHSFYIGLPVRHFVQLFGRNLLVLLKLLFLERKVLVYAVSPVSSVCNCLHSLLSLIPGMLSDPYKHFIAKSPHLSSSPSNSSSFHPLRRKISGPERRTMFGLPLVLFDYIEKSVNSSKTDITTSQQPLGSENGIQETSSVNKSNSLFFYLSLRHLEDMKAANGYLAATSNMFFTRLNHADAFVDVGSGSIDFKNNELPRVLSLTTSDKRFMDNIIQKVNLCEDGDTQWEGSDDWVRAQFATYIESFFASLITVDNILSDKVEELVLSPVVDFNCGWVKAWMKTANFKRWKRTVVPQIITHQASPVHPSGPPSDLLNGLSGSVAVFTSKVAEIELAPVLKDKLGDVRNGLMWGWNKLTEGGSKQTTSTTTTPIAAPISTSTKKQAMPRQQQQQQQQQQQGRQAANFRTEKVAAEHGASRRRQQASK